MTSAMIFVGDCRASLQTLPAQSVHTCVTSPPYFGLRDYDHAGQLGLEPTPGEFVAALVDVFREVRRVLRDDGTVWLNLGDSYARNPAKGGSGVGGKNAKYLGDSYTRAVKKGSSDSCVRRAERPGRKIAGGKEKDLLGIPWRVAFALQDDGWFLRQDIIWSKPNPMPESVTDRCTKAHEYIFLLSKSPRYYFDAQAIREPLAPASLVRLAQNVEAQTGTTRAVGKTNGNLKARGNPATGRNKRSVWTVTTQPFKGAHFATFPRALIEPCILAGSPIGGVVLDPFGGAGTTGLVAEAHGRNSVLLELNPKYAAMAAERIGPSAVVL